MFAPITEYVPQLAGGEEWLRRARAARGAWGAVVVVASVFVGVIALAPLARAGGWGFLSEVLYRGFHTVCHQMPGRSFHVAGFPLAVCARCAGLYAGLLAGLVAYPLLRRPLARTDAPARGWLLAAALPTSVDFALGVSGLWENTHWSRFSTALLPGAAAAFYVVPGVVDLGARYAARRAAAPPGGAGARAAGGRAAS